MARGTPATACARRPRVSSSPSTSARWPSCGAGATSGSVPRPTVSSFGLPALGLGLGQRPAELVEAAGQRQAHLVARQPELVVQLTEGAGLVAVEAETGRQHRPLGVGQYGERVAGQGMQRNHVVVRIGPQVDRLEVPQLVVAVGIRPPVFADEVERLTHASFVALGRRRVNPWSGSVPAQPPSRMVRSTTGASAARCSRSPQTMARSTVEATSTARTLSVPVMLRTLPGRRPGTPTPRALDVSRSR